MVVAVDVARGTIVERLLEPAVAPVWEVLQPIFFPWWDPALHEIRLRLQEAAEELRQKDASVVEALERSLQRGEADALAAALLRAAAQATTKHKMRFLAAAAAGVFTPDLDSEMRSRVSRAVVELEPSDVVALRRALATSPTKSTDRVGGESRDVIPLDRAYEGLIRAGCIGDPSAMGAFVYVTRLGHAVALALKCWKE